MTRILSGEAHEAEGHDRAMRPQTFAEFVGQEPIKIGRASCRERV